MMRIQEDLVTLAAERRLIPFVGAGFSSSLGLPSWESMLRQVHQATDASIAFEELLTATNHDLLQVAEYLYLRHDRQIGPIRHQIERSFSAHGANPLESGPHVELANLSASQIYTTNYDDIIEQTYRRLELPVTPVILPKDVALADQHRTQVVKYHGDLTHERTLVLTESAYYKRLDFESPMDLKFRSDLLGKSVLFMGYSFRDINIRIIWFKLMDMMRDIPEADRRPSYIVRFEPNPALEDLYAAVGLRTVVLDPAREAKTGAARTKLLGEFLLSLSMRADEVSDSHGKSLRAAHEAFVSRALLDEAKARVERVQSFGPVYPGMRHYSGLVGADDVFLKRLFTARVPDVLMAEWQAAAAALVPYAPVSVDVVAVLERIEDADALAKSVISMLTDVGSPEPREGRAALLASGIPWGKVWSAKLSADYLGEILDLFEREIVYQATQGADDDIIPLADLANRIANGQLVDSSRGSKAGDVQRDLVEVAKQLIEIATVVYPSIAHLEVTEGAPELQELSREVDQRRKKFRRVEIDTRLLIGPGTARRRAAAAARAAERAAKSDA